MNAERTEDELNAETKRVQTLLVGIQEACSKSANTPDIYAALTYALGRVISLSNDPATLLCLTIPKLASAAKITCRQLNSLDDLEEALEDDQSDAVTAH
jgi:hypothetical protein